MYIRNDLCWPIIVSSYTTKTMDCFCVNGLSEDDFFQLGYSSDLITLRIEFFYKLGLKTIEEVDVLPCVFTDKTGPTTEEGCPLPYITISKGPEKFLIV